MARIKIIETTIKLIAIFRMDHMQGPVCWFPTGMSTFSIVCSLFDHSFKLLLLNGPSDFSINFLLWIQVR